MSKKTVSIIIGLFIFIAPAWTHAEEGQSCQSSPQASETLKEADKTLSDLRNSMEDKCPSNPTEKDRLKSSLFQSYLSMLTLFVNYKSFACDYKRLVDADENQALSYDMELFRMKLEEFNTLATQAVNYCDNETVVDIQNKKNTFYQEEYLSLCEAENKGSYHQEGYYTKDSEHSCNKEEFKWSEMKKLIERLKQNWQNLKEASKKIQPREGKEIYNEFLQQQGLMPLDEAQKKLSGCGGKTPDNSYKTFFQQLGTCMARPFINIADQLTGKNTGGESTTMSATDDSNTNPTGDLTNEEFVEQQRKKAEIVRKTSVHEERKNIMKPFLNRLVRTTDAKLETTLLETLLNLKGKDAFCDTTKKSADELVKFCQSVDTETGNDKCDNDAVANTPSVECK